MVLVWQTSWDGGEGGVLLPQNQ